MILRAVTDEPRAEFSARQYATLGRLGFEPRSANSDDEFKPAAPNSMIRRAYSSASARHETRECEFYVTQVKSVQLTPVSSLWKWATALKWGPHRRQLPAFRGTA